MIQCGTAATDILEGVRHMYANPVVGQVLDADARADHAFRHRERRRSPYRGPRKARSSGGSIRVTKVVRGDRVRTGSQTTQLPGVVGKCQRTSTQIWARITSTTTGITLDS